MRSPSNFRFRIFMNAQFSVTNWNIVLGDVMLRKTTASFPGKTYFAYFPVACFLFYLSECYDSLLPFFSWAAFVRREFFAQNCYFKFLPLSRKTALA